jgi:hypothetical protein
LLSLVPVLAIVHAPSSAAGDDAWTDPFPGVQRLHRTTPTQDIHALVVDLCAPGVTVRATGPNERERTVPGFADAINAEAAINGDFFSFATYSPTGPAVHNGNVWGGDDNTFVAPLAFGPGEALLAPNGQQDGPPAWATEVVSGHPSIVVGGSIRENASYELCTARHPRTAAGLSEDRRTLVLAVVDGRATDRIGMTCAELAALMIELDAHDAVNLDGGGSSTMWLAGAGVINHPSDGVPRVVANHLAIRATGAGPSPFCVGAPEPPPAPTDPVLDPAVVEIAGDPETADEPSTGCRASRRDHTATWALAVLVAIGVTRRRVHGYNKPVTLPPRKRERTAG